MITEEIKIVLVNWIDSSASGGQWEPRESAAEMKVQQCQAVGYLFENNDPALITLIQCIGGAGEIKSSIINELVIPKVCIQSMIELCPEGLIKE